jgi:hypothetical protein
MNGKNYNSKGVTCEFRGCCKMTCAYTDATKTTCPEFKAFVTDDQVARMLETYDLVRT